MSHLNSFLVKDCDYADPDEMVRDRVVIGCYSSKAREKPIHEGSDLTLENITSSENVSINSVKTKKQKTPVKKKLGKDCGR